MKVIAAPGPVCYPLVAAMMERKDIDIEFKKSSDIGKEKPDVVLDSTVSLVKSGLPIDYVTIENLSRVAPKLGYKIGMTRKGGASDILFRAYVGETKKDVEIQYFESMGELMEAMNANKVDTVVVPAMDNAGVSIEEYFKKNNVAIPGSCGATVYDREKDFVDAYNLGIKILKEKPEEAAKFIISHLPMQFPPEFVMNTMKNSDLNVHKPGDYSEFVRLVKKYSTQ
ncbi:DUF3834 domain-containing protein [Ferroplasma sp.]|uniref:DUF3834 domain-containing protein n=1 Tax=Ferroplasma sp. TaxID=2591003 RepID=UPI002615E17C|nr:DUF3834 domain-containing protein [Ferroplasma sp.]MCL4453038.1 DUF3834 domain-containing protein [Candidatus Thermoplasmatota archaeon]